MSQAENTKPAAAAASPAGNPEELSLPCSLQLTFDPSRSRNSVHFTFSDIGFEVIEDGSKVGEVIGCLGGAMEFRVSELTYTLDTRALWRAVRDALPKAEETP